MFLVHLFLLLFMWWWWGIASPPAVSPAGTEQSQLTLPEEYFQQHFKSIINFIFTNIQLFSREFVTDKTGHSTFVNSKASECQADLIHNSCRSESSNTCLVAVLDTRSFHPAVSPAGTEQSYLTLPQEYFQQHFKSIINFIFIKSIIRY